MASRTSTIAIALAILLTQAACARAAIYWGATINAEVYGQSGTAPSNESAWNTFEEHAGKRITILSFSQAWGEFNAAELQAVHNRGAIPLVVTGLGPGVTLEEIAAGGQDAEIKAWAAKAKAWGSPFLFAPWREMNGGWYSWGQNPSFVAAWRHFHDLVVETGATNVTWVWVPNGIWSDPASDPAPYYPGDAYVDWTGVDVYNWGDNPLHPNFWFSPDQTLTATLNRIEEIAPGKPICVAENASTEIGGNKAQWIRSLLTAYLPHHPEIKAYVWFNWNNFQYGGRFDWQIESSAPAQEAFRKGIQSGMYLSELPPLAPLSKVPMPTAPPGGGGPQPADLSTPGNDAEAPQVAVAPDGTGTAVWSRSGGSHFVVQARRLAAGGQFGAKTEDLSAPEEDALEPQIGMAGDGTATVVWDRLAGSKGVVEERRLTPDGAPDATTDLTGSGRPVVEPQVAVAPDGTATVVWSRYDGSEEVVEGRRVSPDGTPAANTAALSESGQNAVEPQVAVAPDGTATVVWSRYDGSDFIVQERRVTPDGSLEPGPQSLSASGQNAVEPQVAVAPDGTATVVWSRYDGSDFIVQERRVAPGGSLPAAAQNLSGSGGDAVEPQVAVDPDGVATVLWSRSGSSSPMVQDRGITAGGAADAGTQSLSAGGEAAGAPQLAGQSENAVIAVWRRFDGSHDVVQASALVRPVLLLQPASHDFGQLPVGSRTTQQFVVANAGGAPLTIRSLSLEDASASGFALEGAGACTAAPIAPGAHCDVTVSFAPLAVGGSSARLVIVSNASFGAEVAPLTGRGVSSASAAVRHSSAVPSNAFSIGGPRSNRRRGTAMLPVTVPGPGELQLRGAGVATASRSVPAGPATALVPVRAIGEKRRSLGRTGNVLVRVEVTFDPAGGTPGSRSATLRLRKRIP